MALPEIIKKGAEKKIAAFCDGRVPPELHDKLRHGFRFRGNSATLFETRPWFQNPKKWRELVVAQFRFDEQAKTWALYCRDRNERWHSYDLVDPTANLDALLEEVDRDPTGIFWG